MATKTKHYFAEQILNKIASGDRPADEKLHPKDIMLVMDQVMGFLSGENFSENYVRYGKKDVNRVGLDPLPGVLSMLPNWRFTFDGLTKIEFLRKYFRSINIVHSYRSTYTVGSFISNPFYGEVAAGYVHPQARDASMLAKSRLRVAAS